MNFLYPAFLALLLIPLLLLALLIWSERRRTKTWRALVSEQHEKTLVTRLPAYRRTLPSLLTLLALSGLILALARPFNGYSEQNTESSSRNLLIALDVSRSMETDDISPSRLDEARAAAYELIDALPADKMGLIVFSGESELVVPLTYDHSALKSTLAQVDRTWAPYGGTNYGRVLEKAMEDFARSAPTGTNAVVIFSDGEDTVGSTLEIAEQARKKKLLVITVGVGTEAGAAIPDSKGENGLYQDRDGKHVISKLNSKSLIEFARATGGDYFAMGSGADLTSFAQSATEQLDYHENKASLTKSPNDLFVYFLIPSGVLLLISILLGTEWRNPRKKTLSLIAYLCLLASQPSLLRADDTLYSEVKQALQDKQYDKGKKLILDAITRDPELATDSPLSLALGTAYLNLGEEQLAREAFSQALLSDDPQLQAATTYQIGNINTENTFQQLRQLYAPAPPPSGDQPAESTPKVSAKQLEDIEKQLKQDQQHFRDALELDAQHTASKSNLEKIDRFLEALRKEIERLKKEEQQQQDQNKDQQNKDQQNKDQQNKDQQNKDQQNKDQQNKDQQNKDQQNKDQQNKDQQNKDQQNKDQQDQQQQDKGKDQQDQQQQDKGKDQQDQQQKDQQDKDQEQQKQQVAPAELSEEEKKAQRARAILQMHLDEENDAPVRNVSHGQHPEKDY